MALVFKILETLVFTLVIRLVMQVAFKLTRPPPQALHPHDKHLLDLVEAAWSDTAPRTRGGGSAVGQAPGGDVMAVAERPRNAVPDVAPAEAVAVPKTPPNAGADMDATQRKYLLPASPPQDADDPSVVGATGTPAMAPTSDSANPDMAAKVVQPHRGAVSPLPAAYVHSAMQRLGQARPGNGAAAASAPDTDNGTAPAAPNADCDTGPAPLPAATNGAAPVPAPDADHGAAPAAEQDAGNTTAPAPAVNTHNGEAPAASSPLPAPLTSVKTVQARADSGVVAVDEVSLQGCAG